MNEGSPSEDSHPRRVKVVHLITLLELGGAQGNTIHTVRSLDPARFDARLWCGRGGYWDSDVEKDLGTAGRLRYISRLVRPIRPISDILAIFELWRAFAKERPDVVHTHSSKAGIVGRIAARLAGVPIILHTYHGFGFNDRQNVWIRSLFVRLERLTARWSQKLLFVSRSNVATAQTLNIGTPQQYEVVRSGVSFGALSRVRAETHRDEVRKELNLPLSSRIVSSISAFKPQKNLADFIAVARLVCAAKNDVYFLLIGDGEQRAELERLSEAAHLKERVLMPGWRQDAARLLAGSDLFVLTSLWEGLPRALVEAIALGIPAACYDADGVQDLLQNRPQAVPRGDVAALATAVLRLLNDPSHARAVAAQQQERLSDEFDIDYMVRRIETLYDGLIFAVLPAPRSS